MAKAPLGGSSRLLREHYPAYFAQLLRGKKKEKEEEKKKKKKKKKKKSRCWTETRAFMQIALQRHPGTIRADYRSLPRATPRFASDKSGNLRMRYRDRRPARHAALNQRESTRGRYLSLGDN